MCPTEESRMNYYVPIQDDETSPCKKKKCNKPIRASSCGSYPWKKRRRRYASTSYKYFDTGIRVGVVSCVELVLGDNRGNQIVLFFETWKSLMQKRADISNDFYNRLKLHCGFEI
ncbi:uncharacterized protein LOC115234593 [Formica exsecta]|uniref:uncharacterized protein LOC115234593 n=1 Tax=Formica exsecta TaxID=72781 RepID=UPI001143E359|nr:uncharacterized protein LOC115234593 [Formica exsecta]